jgi:hypothetical protein
MPLHERYLPDLNLLLVRGVGSVTAKDFIALNERQRDAETARDRDVLVDLRSINALVIVPDELTRFVTLDAEYHEAGVFTRGRRRVVIGRGEMEEAMTQLYKAMLQRRPEAAPVAAGTVSMPTLESALVFLQRSEARTRIEEALDALTRTGQDEAPSTS